MTLLIDKPAPFVHRYNVGDTERFLDVLLSGEATDWQQGTTGGPFESKTSEHRTNLNFAIEDYVFRNPDDPLVAPFTELVNTIDDSLDHYCDQYDLVLGPWESWGINRYEMGAEYLKHADKGSGNARLLSLIVYLNHVEGGGQTVFPLWDLSIDPTLGTMLVFPSSYPYIHAAEPPTSGAKYSMVTWVNAR